MTLAHAALITSSLFIGALGAKVTWNLTHKAFKYSYQPTDLFGFLLSMIVLINHFRSY